MSFGKNLKTARIKAGMKQADLAKKLGVTEAMISFYESEKRSPNIRFAAAMAKAVGTSLSDLVKDD